MRLKIQDQEYWMETPPPCLPIESVVTGAMEHIGERLFPFCRVQLHGGIEHNPDGVRGKILVSAVDSFHTEVMGFQMRDL